MDAREYFDAAAADYQERTSAGVLGFIRRRERAAVLELLEPRPGDVILDAGCGAGFDALPLMAQGCRVLGVDRSERMVEEARRRGVDAEVGDLHELDLGRTFPKVLCAGPLEFCHDPDRVLARLFAHLAPRGRLVVLFPTRGVVGLAYWAYHRSHGVRIRLFSMRQMRRALARHGFEPGRGRTPTPFTGVLEARRPG